jgi:hypothetical protein
MTTECRHLQIDPVGARSVGPVGGRRRASGIIGIVLALTLAACGGTEQVDWPGVRFPLPVGWEVLEQSTSRLIVADHLAAEGARGVIVTFLRSPETLPDDWRRAVAERGALLESDESVQVAGDVPATQLILRDTVDGIPVREALLVVPSRGLVIAITPRVSAGETDGPDLLLASLDAVREVLDAVSLTPPRAG